jgi:hypothetical protein
LRVLFGEDDGYIQAASHAHEPGGVLDHGVALVNGREQTFLQVNDEQNGLLDFDSHPWIVLWLRCAEAIEVIGKNNCQPRF